MKTFKKFTDKQKTLLSVALVLGSVLVIFALVVYLRAIREDEAALVAQQFSYMMACFAVALLWLVPVTGILAMCLYLLNWRQVRTALHLVMQKVSNKIAMHNCAAIYPWLQEFLFRVLSQNQGTLGLPLGQDAACLTPHGMIPLFRQNCTFYRFELVMPQAPELSEKDLWQLVQTMIGGELYNYGVPALPAYFSSLNSGMIPSVYLDRVFYSPGTKLLTFDLLYICTEAAASYFAKALKRDTPIAQPEAEVFDDEIR